MSRDFTFVEVRGLEPLTLCLQSREFRCVVAGERCGWIHGRQTTGRSPVLPGVYGVVEALEERLDTPWGQVTVMIHRYRRTRVTHGP